MSGIPRRPRDRNPARPPKRDDERDLQEHREPRSYGQSAPPPTADELEEMQQIEDLTDEPVREGDDNADTGSGTVVAWKKCKEREFEDLAGEPVGVDTV